MRNRKHLRRLGTSSSISPSLDSLPLWQFGNSDIFSVEIELARINQRLDDVTTLLNSAPYHSKFAGNPASDWITFNDDERSPFELLGTQVMMNILGLNANFALQLRQVERAASSTTRLFSARLYMVTHQQALRSV